MAIASAAKNVEEPLADDKERIVFVKKLIKFLFKYFNKNLIRTWVGTWTRIWYELEKEVDRNLKLYINK